MGKLFLAAMMRPVSAARSISLAITISTGIRSKRRATNSAWRLPISESGVSKCWYAPCSLPSVDPCRTKYTVFISALVFVPHRNARLIRRAIITSPDPLAQPEDGARPEDGLDGVQGVPRYSQDVCIVPWFEVPLAVGDVTGRGRLGGGGGEHDGVA